MKNFPLQLKHLVLREISCKAAESTQSGQEFARTIALTANPTFGRGEDDPRQWQVTLKVAFKAGEGETKPLQYTGHLELVGVFQMEAEDVTEEVLLRMVALNGPSVLYASARDTISTLTARGPHGILLLPMVTFSDCTIAVTSGTKPRPEVAKEIERASKAKAR